MMTTFISTLGFYFQPPCVSMPLIHGGGVLSWDVFFGGEFCMAEDHVEHA